MEIKYQGKTYKMKDGFTCTQCDLWDAKKHCNKCPVDMADVCKSKGVVFKEEIKCLK